MTIVSNPVTGLVLGQPVSPFFGQQSAGGAPANVTIPQPGTTITNAPQLTMLEAVSRGSLPRNADVSSVNGVSTGAQNPTPIDDLMGNGAGNQVNAGVAVSNFAGNFAGNPTNGALNQEVLVGALVAPAPQTNGPAPTNTETLTSCPLSGATLVANLTLSGSYQG